MKVKIRKVKLSDAKRIRELINDKDIIKQLDGVPYPCPLDYIKKDISNGLKNWKKKLAYIFVILLDNNVVGEVILENPNQSKKSYEIGYFLGKKYWGKGITAKAVKEVMKFAFNKLKIKRIWGGTFPENPASGDVLKQAGFKLEGRLRKSTYKNGKYYDELIWGYVN